MADHTWADHPPIDVLVIPGGQGTRPMLGDEEVRRWVRDRSRRSAIWSRAYAPVRWCWPTTGSSTTARPPPTGRHSNNWRHWAPTSTCAGEVRFVDDGDVITAAGVSAGIDMALHLVARLSSTERAREVRRIIQYDPDPPV